MIPSARRCSWHWAMRKIWYAIVSCLFLVALIVTSVELVVFDMNFYRQEFETLNRYEEMGMAEVDLQATTKELLSYVRGNRDDLTMEFPVHGQLRPIFNQKEIDHMVDVRELYLTARNVRRIGWAAMLATILFLLFKKRATYQKYERQKEFRLLAKTMMASMVGIGVVVLLLGLVYATNFDLFWTTFHKLSFSNDLWLLDPRTDLLIQMVPEQFFIDCVGKIIVYSVAMLAVALLGSVLVVRSGKKQLA